MSTVNSVSEITHKLSTTIQSNPTLQNVRVQGEVRNRIGPRSFFLRQEDGSGEKILRCFIPDPIPFADALIRQGNTVVVKGYIKPFPIASQYEVKVREIQAPGVNGNGSNVKDVAGITKRISNLVTRTTELQNIQIQGTISRIPGIPVGPVWILRDNDDEHYTLNVFIPFTINDPEEGKVCVQGTVSIFSPKSRYQIEVTAIGDAPTCQCPGYESCCSPEGRCNEAREPEYELCPQCYADSEDHEEEVVKEVKKYFCGIGVNGFSPKTQHEIQIGTKNGIADVVLVKDDGTEIFAAIAECKGAGYVGEGKRQLKSYLSATDARFGVFANRADKEHWKFYENRRRNRFDCIPRDQFEDGIVKGITHRKQLKDEIGDLERQKGKLTEEIQLSETFFEALKKDLSDQFKTFLADLKSNLPDSE